MGIKNIIKLRVLKRELKEDDQIIQINKKLQKLKRKLNNLKIEHRMLFKKQDLSPNRPTTNQEDISIHEIRSNQKQRSILARKRSMSFSYKSNWCDKHDQQQNKCQRKGYTQDDCNDQLAFEKMFDDQIGQSRKFDEYNHSSSCSPPCSSCSSEQLSHNCDEDQQLDKFILERQQKRYDEITGIQDKVKEELQQRFKTFKLQNNSEQQNQTTLSENENRRSAINKSIMNSTQKSILSPRPFDSFKKNQKEQDNSGVTSKKLWQTLPQKINERRSSSMVIKGNIESIIEENFMKSSKRKKKYIEFQQKLRSEIKRQYQRELRELNMSQFQINFRAKQINLIKRMFNDDSQTIIIVQQDEADLVNAMNIQDKLLVIDRIHQKIGRQYGQNNRFFINSIDFKAFKTQLIKIILIKDLDLQTFKKIEKDGCIQKNEEFNGYQSEYFMASQTLDKNKYIGKRLNSELKNQKKQKASQKLSKLTNKVIELQNISYIKFAKKIQKKLRERHQVEFDLFFHFQEYQISYKKRDILDINFNYDDQAEDSDEEIHEYMKQINQFNDKYNQIILTKSQIKEIKLDIKKKKDEEKRIILQKHQLSKKKRQQIMKRILNLGQIFLAVISVIDILSSYLLLNSLHKQFCVRRNGLIIQGNKTSHTQCTSIYQFANTESFRHEFYLTTKNIQLFVCFLYPIIGFVFFKKQFDEINVERDNQGHVLGNQMYLPWERYVRYAIAYILGPWIFKLRFMHKILFAKLGFRKFTKDFYTDNEDRMINRYFRASLFIQTLLDTLPVLVTQIIIHHYYQNWTFTGILSVSVKTINIVFQMSFAQFRLFEGFWDPNVWIQRINMIICTMPVLILVLFADLGLICSTIIALLKAQTTCQKNMTVYIICSMINGLSLTLKVTIIAIQHGNINNLYQLTNRKFFRSLCLLNFISLVIMIIDLIMSGCEAYYQIYIMYAFIILSMFQQIFLKLVIERLRKFQIQQIRQKYEWHHNLHKQAHNIFKSIPREMKQEMSHTRTLEVWNQFGPLMIPFRHQFQIMREILQIESNYQKGNKVSNVHFRDLSPTTCSTGTTFYQGQMRVTQMLRGGNWVLNINSENRPQRFGYGRFFYFKNDNDGMCDILCNIINDSDQSGRQEVAAVHNEVASLSDQKATMIMEGIWKKGRLDGYGRTIDFKGNVYLGEYHQGKKQGHGQFFWFNGDIYDGMWHDDKQEGKGVFYMNETEESYIGMWYNGAIKLVGDEDVYHENQQMSFWRNGYLIPNEQLASSQIYKFLVKDNLQKY